MKNRHYPTAPPRSARKRYGARREPASVSLRYRLGLLTLLFGWFLADVSTGDVSAFGAGLATLGFLVGAVGVLSPE